MNKQHFASQIARLAAASGDDTVRFDANETAFLERELTQQRAKLFEVQYPDNVAMSFVPLATDIAADADTHSTPVLDRTGRAKLIGNGVTDVPRVDLKKDEILGKVKTLGASYAFELMELRKAARLGLPIEQWKGRAARAAIDDEQDEMLGFGRTSTQLTGTGLTGIANNALVVVKTDHFTVWASSDTSDALLSELQKPATTINAAIKYKSTLSPNTMLLAPSMYDIIANKPVGTTSDMTVLRWFLANNPYIRSVLPWVKLETANAGGTAQRSVIYRRDSVVLEGIVPIAFEQLPPQAQGLELVTNCLGRNGGTSVYHPEAVLYCDHTG